MRDTHPSCHAGCGEAAVGSGYPADSVAITSASTGERFLPEPDSPCWHAQRGAGRAVLYAEADSGIPRSTRQEGLMFKVYVPYSDHLKSVAVLDDDLLWNQLNDTVLLCQTLVDTPPNTNMLVAKQWSGYEGWLLLYIRRMQVEAQKRGLDSWLDDDGDSPYAEAWRILRKGDKRLAPLAPRWIGGHWFLASQRSELIRIAPEHYAHRFPTTPLEMPFLYPQNTETFDYTIAVSKRDSDLLEDHERCIPAPFVEHVRAKGLLW